ncbi:unnamed protein product, partial [Chrysoparadoxa australica]
RDPTNPHHLASLLQGQVVGAKRLLMEEDLELEVRADLPSKSCALIAAGEPSPPAWMDALRQVWVREISDELCGLEESNTSLQFEKFEKEKLWAETAGAADNRCPAADNEVDLKHNEEDALRKSINQSLTGLQLSAASMYEGLPDFEETNEATNPQASSRSKAIWIKVMEAFNCGYSYTPHTMTPAQEAAERAAKPSDTRLEEYIEGLKRLQVPLSEGTTAAAKEKEGLYVDLKQQEADIRKAGREDVLPLFHQVKHLRAHHAHLLEERAIQRQAVIEARERVAAAVLRQAQLAEGHSNPSGPPSSHAGDEGETAPSAGGASLAPDSIEEELFVAPINLLLDDATLRTLGRQLRLCAVSCTNALSELQTALLAAPKRKTDGGTTSRRQKVLSVLSKYTALDEGLSPQKFCLDIYIPQPATGYKDDRQGWDSERRQCEDGFAELMRDASEPDGRLMHRFIKDGKAKAPPSVNQVAASGSRSGCSNGSSGSNDRDDRRRTRTGSNRLGWSKALLLGGCRSGGSRGAGRNQADTGSSSSSSAQATTQLRTDTLVAFSNYFSQHLKELHRIPEELMPAVEVLVRGLLLRECRLALQSANKQALDDMDAKWRDKATSLREMTSLEFLLGVEPRLLPGNRSSMLGELSVPIHDFRRQSQGSSHSSFS